MKRKRVLPPRQPSSTKASGSPHGQSTSTAGILNGQSSTKQSTLTHAEAQFEFLSPQKWKQLSENK